MRVIIKPDYTAMSAWTADYIAKKINNYHPSDNRNFVLGLPTGSTPLGTYAELIKKHQRGELSFAKVTTFNMDEYVGLAPEHTQSYHYFMNENFFRHIDIKENNIHILDGMASDTTRECAEYEKAIMQAGGINLFLGGLGEDGHIAFNEPFSSLTSRTRIKTLTSDTIRANSRFFDNDISKVPTTALTVGVETITDAQEVLILASGKAKARAIRAAIDEQINHKWPVSILQMHRHAIIVCDQSAAEQLSPETIKYFLDIEKNAL